MKHKKEWYVLINGEKITVSREVYLEYYRPVWRESKRRAVRVEMECSLEMMASYGGTVVDVSADVGDLVANKLQADRLYETLAEFTNAERDLIRVICFQGKSEREYAAESGIPQKTINDRKKRIIKRLQIKIEKY